MSFFADLGAESLPLILVIRRATNVQIQENPLKILEIAYNKNLETFLQTTLVIKIITSISLFRGTHFLKIAITNQFSCLSLGELILQSCKGSCGKPSDYTCISEFQEELVLVFLFIEPLDFIRRLCRRIVLSFL